MRSAFADSSLRHTNPRVAHMSSIHDALFIRLFFKVAVTTANAGYETFCIAVHPRREVIQNVTIVPVPRFSGPIGRIRASWFTYRAAVAVNPSVCHIHTPLLYPWIPLLRMRGIQVIVDMYENQPAAVELRSSVPAILRKPVAGLYRLVEKILIYGVPVIFAEHSYAKEYPWVRRSCTVLNMPLLEKLLPVQGDKRAVLTIGYLGAISEERGSVIMLNALDILRRRGIEVSLEFIGAASAKHQAQLDKHVTNLGLQERVHFRGLMLPADAYRIAAEWHLALAVLLPKRNYIESYPTKLFEYMGLGLPVVASRFPLYEGIVVNEKCGLCVDPCNPVELADAVLAIVNNPSLSKQMGDNGRLAVIQRYSWANEAKKLMVFYESLLAQKPAS